MVSYYLEDNTRLIAKDLPIKFKTCVKSLILVIINLTYALELSGSFDNILKLVEAA